MLYSLIVLGYKFRINSQVKTPARSEKGNRINEMINEFLLSGKVSKLKMGEIE